MYKIPKSKGKKVEVGEVLGKRTCDVGAADQDLII